MFRIHRRLNSFIIIVIIFSLGLNWAFAGSYTATSFDTEAEYAKSLIDGRTQPKIEDSAASADIGKFYSNDNKKGSKADLVDIREIYRSEDTITYRAVKVSTKKVKVNSRSVKAPNVDLSGTLLSDIGPMTALSGSDEDTYCDVTYFTTLVYDRKASPDPAIDFCYRITSVKGGIISKSDPQISVTKLVLGYAEHGQYWVNGTGSGYVGTLKNMTKYSKSYPALGTTYATSGPSQAYYYCIEDGFSGIQGRSTIYVKRLNSTFTGSDYLDFVKGTEYLDW